jgi:serine/threonine-protein kinase
MKRMGDLHDREQALQPGFVLGGRYRIQRRIGSGGMGTVYAATHLSLGREVALKVIDRRHSFDARAVERFRREARVSAQARHPNIVDVIDLGHADDHWYLSMELLDGLDLFEAIKLKRCYEVDEMVPVLDQLLDGLSAAHALGVVHRDLKPENIYLARSRDELLVKIVDFGVVKVVDEGAEMQLTRTGTVVGTPEYMAPEQARGNRVDARTDLYAVGCIAYAMLCGRPPFADKSMLLVLAKHVAEPPQPVSVRRPELRMGAEIDRFFERALAKEPEARFQSAAEMRKALADLAARLGEPDAPRRKLTFSSQRMTSPFQTAPANLPMLEGLSQPARAETPRPAAEPVRSAPAEPQAVAAPPSTTWRVVLAAILGAAFAGGLVYLLLRGAH